MLSKIMTIKLLLFILPVEDRRSLHSSFPGNKTLSIFTAAEEGNEGCI